MAEIRSLIVGELNKAADDIRANMSNKGVNASGRTAASLRVEDKGKSLVLVIGGDRSVYGRTAPLETLEVGRPGGNVPMWFKSIIHQWTIDKGMTFESESHRWAVSTIIARNIEESGTERHRHHIDIYTSVVKKTVDGIRSILAGDFSATMQTLIKTYTK